MKVISAEDAEELLAALRDMWDQGCGSTPSCGHDYHCICPSDRTRAILDKFPKSE